MKLEQSDYTAVIYEQKWIHMDYWNPKDEIVIRVERCKDAVLLD